MHPVHSTVDLEYQFHLNLIITNLGDEICGQRDGHNLLYMLSFCANLFNNL
jgi:hypothetical protein